MRTPCNLFSLKRMVFDYWDKKVTNCRGASALKVETHASTLRSPSFHGTYSDRCTDRVKGDVSPSEEPGIERGTASSSDRGKKGVRSLGRPISNQRSPSLTLRFLLLLLLFLLGRRLRMLRRRCRARLRWRRSMLRRTFAWRRSRRTFRRAWSWRRRLCRTVIRRWLIRLRTIRLRLIVRLR